MRRAYGGPQPRASFPLPAPQSKRQSSSIALRWTSKHWMEIRGIRIFDDQLPVQDLDFANWQSENVRPQLVIKLGTFEVLGALLQSTIIARSLS